MATRLLAFGVTGITVYAWWSSQISKEKAIGICLLTITLTYMRMQAADPYGTFHYKLNWVPGQSPTERPKTEWLNLGYWKVSHTQRSVSCLYLLIHLSSVRTPMYFLMHAKVYMLSSCTDQHAQLILYKALALKLSRAAGYSAGGHILGLCLLRSPDSTSHINLRCRIRKWRISGHASDPSGCASACIFDRNH
jgi:hypothetical protein